MRSRDMTTAVSVFPEKKTNHNILERYNTMSKAKNRKDPTAATIRLKDKRVLKSSDGAFETVASLERHRIEETKKNQATKKKNKKD